jgi:hypothetical protein
MRNRKFVLFGTLALATIGGLALSNREAAAQTATPPGHASAPPEPPPPPVVLPYPGGHPGYHHGLGLFGDTRYRSPGLAVALSLTPLPIDFGNLYAENIGWGVAYSALEVSMMVPMMWFVGGHMNHRWDDDRRWSSGESNTMVGLVAGYVAVKLVAGLHAGYAARGLNRRTGSDPFAGVLPVRGGGVAILASSF